MIIFVGFVSLLVLMALAVPIGFALGLAGIISLPALIPTGSIAALLGHVVHGTAANGVLLALPMFVLMAEFLACGGIATDLLLACHRMLRRVRGGLAMACIMAGVIHASATGSSGASAASLSRATFPAMMKAGYSAAFSSGTIAIAGTLAMLIPPSIAFILYGLVTETSIGKLFIAGILPGILTASGYILTISLVMRLRPQWAAPNENKVQLLGEGGIGIERRSKVWPMLLLIVIVIGGLYSGLATPIEVSAIGALGAFLIAFFSGRMSRPDFVGAVGMTLRITTMVVTIMIGAYVLGYFISFSRATDTILLWISESGLSPGAVVAFLVFLYLVLGIFLDQAAIVILTAPVTTALIVGLGFDPIWWGVIIIKTAEIGMIHPPLGMVVFITSQATGVNLRDCYVGVIPYLMTEFVILGILLMVPEISLYLTR